MGKNLFSKYFNSIKVQLERHRSQNYNVYGTFQFHKGTIRTDNEEYRKHNLYQFQFHKGTIRTHHNRRPSFFTIISIP